MLYKKDSLILLRDAPADGDYILGVYRVLADFEYDDQLRAYLAEQNPPLEWFEWNSTLFVEWLKARCLLAAAPIHFISVAGTLGPWFSDGSEVPGFQLPPNGLRNRLLMDFSWDTFDSLG